MAQNLEELDNEVSQFAREVQDAIDGDPRPGTRADVVGDAELEPEEANDNEADALAGLETAADVRATLGNVASGLAEQLTSITEEMNKIRQELYGESGIGGIAKELEKLKAGGLGGLGGLLDSDSLDEGLGGGGLGSSVLGGSGLGGGGLGDSSFGDSGLGGSSSSRARSSGSKHAVDESRPVRHSRADLDDLATKELKRKYLERRNAMKSSSSVSTWVVLEKLMLFVLILVCLYVGSPLFRTSVQRAVAGFIGVPFEEEGDDEEYESYY